MAFKDVRDLAEHLKQLDYPHRFTISTLYTPHGCEASFGVVAEILQWLSGRLEPGAILPGGVTTVPERVLLIRSAAEFFVTKAGIRLNPRRLYASSVATAVELLKVTGLLLQAPQNVDENDDGADDAGGADGDSIAAVDLGDKIDELRRARELSSELTNTGALLYDMLAKELHNKETRNMQASRPLELASVEKSLKTAIQAMTQKLQMSRHQLETSKVERNTLQAKVDRKQAELERVRQRLEALQKIRPAFLEEFEKLEIDLKTLFDQYIVRVRCLYALRAQVAARVKMPNQHQFPLAQTTAAADTSISFLHGEELFDSDEEPTNDNDDDDELRIPGERGSTRPPARVGGGRPVVATGDEATAMAEAGLMIRESRRAATGNNRLRVRTAANRGAAGNGGDRRFVGNMMGGGSDMDSSLGSDDDDDDEGDSEDDSEMKLMGRGMMMHSDEDDDDDDENDDGLRRGANEKIAIKKAVLSDEDF